MNTRLEFDLDLLRRYDRPGPRYTSYPSAPQFSPRFTDADFRRQAARSNQEPIPRDLSLYVHVPFCFSPCFYCGCNRIITRDVSRGAPYAERLVREAEMVAPLFDRDRDVVQLHFGGGTPNFLDAPALAGPGRQPRAVLPFLECANPRFFHRARSAQCPRRRHRGVRRHGFQSRKLRRAGLRSSGSTGDQSRAEHRRDAARHRRLPHFRISFRQRRSHLWPAAPDARGISPHAEHHRARAPGSRGGLRLCAHAAEVQGAAADRRDANCPMPPSGSRCCRWRSSA